MIPTTTILGFRRGLDATAFSEILSLGLQVPSEKVFGVGLEGLNTF